MAMLTCWMRPNTTILLETRCKLSPWIGFSEMPVALKQQDSARCSPIRSDSIGLLSLLNPLESFAGGTKARISLQSVREFANGPLLVSFFGENYTKVIVCRG
jgi:hypothetical protein